MSTGQCITTTGRKIANHRTFMSSPDLTAPEWFEVGTGTNTPAISDTTLQTPISIGGGASKAVVSGYPVFDDVNNQTTQRSLLLTTDCNGNTITEYGLVNNDGTPLLFSRAVFTGIVKTTSVQVIIVEKDVVS